MDNPALVINHVQLIVHLLVLLQHLRKLRTGLRRWWNKPHLSVQERRMFGSHGTIFTYFFRENHEEFYNFVGMSVAQFSYLHELVEPYLEKSSKRQPLTPEFRLASVLK